MVAYTSAPGDLEMGAEQKTVVFLEKKSPTEWIWKLAGALFIVALCSGGILFFALYWNGSPDVTSESGQTEALIEKDTAQKTEINNLRHVGSKAKAAIHLEGNYDEDDSDNTLKWKSGQGQGFAQGGFHTHNNTIIVPDSGLYFVYSQASFRVSCSECDEHGARNTVTPLSHRIWRFSDSVGSKASLMGAIRSVCQSAAQEEGRGWYSAIYLGAMFKLNRGDKLWTETNHLSHLETEDGKTFFGVFKL